MLGFGRLEFRGIDKKLQKSEDLAREYEALKPIGRIRLGERYLFYKDLGKKYYVPYSYIDRSFTRISECQPDDSPAYYYYRLILVHDGVEFANLIFNKEEDVDRIHELLKERHPEIKYGYLPPADGKERPKFM